MKLKKIASLMLAGVMAVSMLAGCSGKTDDDNNGGAGTEVTPTSSTATTLRAELGGNARVNVKAVANNKLDSALKDAIDDYVNDSQLSLIAGKYYVEGNDVRTWNVGKAVIKAMGNKNSIANDIVMTNDKTTTAVEIYAFDASVSDQAVLEWVANKIDTYVANYKDKSDDGEYKYTYDLSASIVSKTNTFAGLTGGAKFVAFAVTQNVTEVV